MVTAGPGAGKTRILSYRYCFLLLMDDRLSVPGILTLTFTEKAAEEMKARIYSMLSQLDQLLKDKPGVEEGVREKIHEAREQFFKNNISTIHAFCADLLRDHPVESGLDPNFRIVKGVRRKKLLEEAIENGIAGAWQARKEGMIKLFRSFGGRMRLMRSIGETIDHPLIFDVILRTKGFLFNRPDWPSKAFQDYCEYIKENKLSPYSKGLKAMGDGKEKTGFLLNALEEWQNQADQDSAYLGVPRVFETFRSIAAERKSGESRLAVQQGLQDLSYVDLVQEFYPDIFRSLDPDRLFENELILYLELAADCLDKFRGLKRQINGLDFADLESHCHGLLTRLYQGGEGEMWKRIQNRFPYIMVDEFQDTNRVQWDIIRLLSSEINRKGESRLQPGKLFVVGDKRQAIYRFRGGDVTVFEKVTREIKQSNPLESPAMFWENEEIKRRIESFSNHDSRWVSAFQEGFDKLTSDEQESILNGDIYLPHNFRTDEVPIRFFNKTFQSIFSNKDAQELLPYETAPKPIIRPQVNDNEIESQGSVTIYLNKNSLRGSDQAEVEASLVVDIIEGIMGRRGMDNYEYNAFGDIRAKIKANRTAIGVLFFSFNHIKIYEKVLREAGLPFIVHRGKGFFRSQEVMEILQLLNYLTDERQRISFLAALRSPVFGLSDPEIFDLFYDQPVDLNTLFSSENAYIRSLGGQFMTWRTLVDRLTPSELIRRIVLDRGLTAILSVHPNGRQRTANIDKLIDIARGFQEDGEGSLRDFVVYCLEMAEEQEEEGEALIITGGDCPVYLMTIHAAKGLEFPMVIIPQLNRHVPSRPKPGKPIRLYDHLGEGMLPIWPIEIPELDFEKKYTPLGYLTMRSNHLEDVAENRRVFYVGCTRTQNHLILVGKVKEKRNKAEEKQLNSDDYRERATIIDLLDDIYGFQPPTDNESWEEKIPLTADPRIIWPDTQVRSFSGVKYMDMEIEKRFFRRYDKETEARDLTETIESPSYYQLSFKSIRHYRACPLKFYYSVVLGLKVEDVGVEAEDDRPAVHGEDIYTPNDDRFYDSRDALIIGSAIHVYLEKHRFGEPLDHDLLQKIWSQYEEGLKFSDSSAKRVNQKLRSVIQRHLTNVVEDEKLIRLLGSGPHYVEVPFLFSVARGYDFRGFIDRLVSRSEDGEWIILDWKSNDLTGREPEQIAEENDYHLQLACYSWALEEILGEKAKDLFLYFTDTGYLLKSRWQEHPREVVNEIVDKIAKYERDRKLVFKEMQDRERHGLNCRFCEYRGMLGCNQ